MAGPEVRRVAVWGASGHARVVADALRLGGWEVVGFIDDIAPDRRGQSFAGATVLGGADCLESLLGNGVRSMAIGVGDNEARLALGKRAVEAGFELPNAVHPSATVATDAVLGTGVLVAANAVINPAACIGDLVIVNTAAVVEHDCLLGAGVHLAPGGVLAGMVRVGSISLIGAGAVVVDHRTIGERVRIGAGATVIHDVPDRVTVVGSPARPLANQD